MGLSNNKTYYKKFDLWSKFFFKNENLIWYEVQIRLLNNDLSEQN